MLRIDPLGLHVAGRPRRFGFIRQDRRFVARRDIRDVYRQAENVRIGFRDEARDGVLEFWADDAAAASEIVGQLPTSHAVELDATGSRAAQPNDIPLPRRLLGVAAIALNAAASNWEHSLRRYADALAANDSSMVRAAFGSMRQAEQAELEARSILDQAAM